MSDRITELTDKVVNTFKDKLSDATKAAISPQELDNLTELVKEALTKHADSIAEDLRLVMNKLKADIEKPEIGM